ncbi:MAG TPA: RyR domain-containing protein [Candidatus Limnocylindrales bacterium]|nr:RyR domain-containing protein [Candidatus Limnocylindrales bacterium]
MVNRPVASSLSGLRTLFVGIAVVSLTFGFVGIHQHLQNIQQKHVRSIDVLYYALQLFTLGAPHLDEGGPLPLLLEIARFTAPAVTVYAFFEAGRLLFAVELNRLRARRARGHAVVCGDSPLATALIRHLVAAGHKVVNITSLASAEAERAVLRVIGDARDPEVLSDAGIARAEVLYACTGDSAANTAIALTASLRLAKSQLTAAYAHIADPELCLALQARHLGADPNLTLRVDFFQADELAARGLCEAHPIPPLNGRPPCLLILGATHFGCSVIVESARQWRVQEAPLTARLKVIVIDPIAPLAITRLLGRYSFLETVCEIVTYPELTAFIPGPAETPDRVFICYEDDERALKTALTTDRFWTGGRGSVVVRQNQLVSLETAFGAPLDRRLFDDVSSTISLFGVVDAAADPRQIHNDLALRLARILHEGYLVSMRRQYATSPSMVPWNELSERLRQENRAQAADIGHKLSLIGCALAPRIGQGAEHNLTAEEIEKLAIHEHARWCDEKVREGWRHGPRDDAKKLHPRLVPWDDLGEPTRTRNRNAVAMLPESLANCGFRIVNK